MFERKYRLLSTALLLVGLMCTGASAAQAQEDEWAHGQSYSLASVRGNYGVVATYGADIAQALGVQFMDGRGNVRGSAMVNQPGANGTRQLVRIRFTGQYTVKRDGTGVLILTLALPGGKTAKAVEDFVITKARVIDGVTVATEIVDAQEEPSHVIPGGVFVTHTYTRRPE